MSNGYRYTGTGQQFRGVPTRDLTQDEYDALGPREQRSVVESGVYEPIAAKVETTPPATPKKDDDKKGGES